MGKKNNYAIPEHVIVPHINAAIKLKGGCGDTWPPELLEKIRQNCGYKYAGVPLNDIGGQIRNYRKSSKLNKVNGHGPGKNTKDKIDRECMPEYEKYMLSKKWKKLRKVALDRDGDACRLCGSQKVLDVHHCRYPESHIELNDNVTNLTTLCRKCHTEYHERCNGSKKHRPKKSNGDDSGLPLFASQGRLL